MAEFAALREERPFIRYEFLNPLTIAAVAVSHCPDPLLKGSVISR